MKNNKIYTWLIAILFITNITMLSFFLLHKKEARRDKREDRQNMIARLLKDEIHFSDEQVAQYRQLSNAHMDRMKPLFDSMGTAKDQQFKMLAANNFSDSIMQAQASASGRNQEKVELQLFQHLKNIRNLCTPAQLPVFDTSFAKVLRKNRQEPGKKKKK